MSYTNILCVFLLVDSCKDRQEVKRQREREMIYSWGSTAGIEPALLRSHGIASKPPDHQDASSEMFHFILHRRPIWFAFWQKVVLGDAESLAHSPHSANKSHKSKISPDIAHSTQHPLELTSSLFTRSEKKCCEMVKIWRNLMRVSRRKSTPGLKFSRIRQQTKVTQQRPPAWQGN